MIGSRSLREEGAYSNLVVMTASLQELEDIVTQCARQVKALVDPDWSGDAIERLFGEHGAFDSLGLVQVILEVEDRIESRFGVRLTLASEQAMSRRSSPFRSVASLAEFALELLSAEAPRG
jgi:acyl carrier protein